MSEQRKIYIVKKDFQHSHILEGLLIVFITINLVVAAGYLFLDSAADFQRLKMIIVTSIAGIEILALFFVFRYKLIVSNRIAGPLYVLERYLTAMQQGDLSFTMTLRQKDHFHEVKDQLNDTVADMRQQISSAQQACEALKPQLEKNPEAAQHYQQLQQALAYFKTEASANTAESSDEQTQTNSKSAKP